MVRLAGTQGFANVTFDDLSNAVGLPAGEVEAHVESLDGLFAAAYSELSGRLLDHYRTAFLAEPAWGARFAAGAQAVFEIYKLEPELARLCHMEVGRAGERTRAAGDAAKREWVAFVADTLDDEQEIPRLHFELVCGALNQATEEAIRDHGTSDIDLLGTRLRLIAETLEPVSA